MQNIWQSCKTIIFIIILLWLIFAIGLIIPLDWLGIKPRSISGLPGIIFAPFIHAGIDHLLANSISLLLLGTAFFAIERRLPLFILLFIIITGGLGTWIIGRSGYLHIGASGVIYGILGYLLAMGVFARNIKAILVSVLVFVLYGGMVWGIFPSDGFISWESHLCGFIAGIIAARFYARSGNA